MFFAKTPFILKNYYNELVWQLPSDDKTIYLTFDDGPTESITNWVLDQLKMYDAKATFFCIGKNVKKNEALYRKIIKDGHAVGNHSYSHLKGWETKNNVYYKDITRCSKIVESKLLRPPYGKIKRSQIKPLAAKYQIIMWDVLSGDYSQSLSKNRCLSNVIDNTEEGSIVVFHDSIKAKENLFFVLPKVLKHFHDLGFQFKSIDKNALESTK